MPELFEVQKIALESGALMSTLSGSGSTFFTPLPMEMNALQIPQPLEGRKFPLKIIRGNFQVRKPPGKN